MVGRGYGGGASTPRSITTDLLLKVVPLAYRASRRRTLSAGASAPQHFTFGRTAIMRNIRMALFIMLPLFSIPVSAQSVTAESQRLSARLSASAEDDQRVTQDQPSRKDPGTATIISILVVGGGQIYSGEINRGLLMLGSAYGAIIMGSVLSSCDLSGFGGCNYTPLYLGALGALGMYVYSIADAAPSARRMNARNGFTGGGVTSLMRAGPHGTTQVGLKVAF